MDISCFLNHLARYSGENTFNPWADHDENYEIEKALAIRRANLKDYLTLRIGGARILLVAEACGYQGGHFSGIAMTCERMLLDFHPAVTSAMVLGHRGNRTSRKDSPLLKPIQQEKGFNEPTDSVVWKACLEAGLSPGISFSGTFSPSIPIKKEISSPTAPLRKKNWPQALPIPESSSPSPVPFPSSPSGKRVKIPSPQPALPSPVSGILPTGAPIFSDPS